MELATKKEATRSSLGGSSGVGKEEDQAKLVTKEKAQAKLPMKEESWVELLMQEAWAKLTAKVEGSGGTQDESRLNGMGIGNFLCAGLLMEQEVLSVLTNIE